MTGERPLTDSRATGRLLRWGLVAFAASWALLALVDGALCAIFHWGAFEPLRPPICRMGNLSVLPFAILADFVTPSTGAHADLIHELLRSGFAAGAFTLTVLTLILARRRGRREGRGEVTGQLDRRRALSLITDAGVVGAGLAVGGWTVLIEPGGLRVRPEVGLVVLRRA